MITMTRSHIDSIDFWPRAAFSFVDGGNNFLLSRFYDIDGRTGGDGCVTKNMHAIRNCPRRWVFRKLSQVSRARHPFLPYANGSMAAAVYRNKKKKKINKIICSVFCLSFKRDDGGVWPRFLRLCVVVVVVMLLLSCARYGACARIVYRMVVLGGRGGGRNPRAPPHRRRKVVYPLRPRTRAADRRESISCIFIINFFRVNKNVHVTFIT